MLLNSVVAGAVAAGYILVLVLQLNPQLSRSPAAIVPLGTALLASYGLHFAAVFYGLTVLRQLFGSESLSPGWISVRVLVWECAAAAAIGAALMWLNLAGLRLALEPEAARRMSHGAVALTVCAGLMVALAALRSWAGPRWKVGAAAFVMVLALSLLAPLLARGPGRAQTLGGRRLDLGPSFPGPASASRVVVLAVDGASLDFISPAAADARLPNFARLLDSGASAHLATLRPTQPDPTWTSVATGKLPVHHGVRSSGIYTAWRGGASFDLLPDYCFAHALVYFGFLAEAPQTSASLRARTVWSVLGGSGIGSAVVRWPLSYPAQPMQGVIVSDRLHLPAAAGLDPDEPPATYPEDLLATIRQHPGQQDLADAALSLYGSTREPYAGAGALARDRLYADVFDQVRDTPGTRLSVLRYQGIDVAGHYYLRQAMPRAFGEATGEPPPGGAARVLEQYYRFLDGEVGRALDRLGPDDLLLVVSAFGMEPLSLPKRLIDRAFGGGGLSGTHERAPDGFVVAFGRAVEPGRLPRASVLDVTPTILYFFGLPIGRDMDGFARTDIFTRAFTAERPVTYIPTYER
jgi:hypothetical protein